MKKDKLTREEIEAIPRKERSLDNWELLAEYKAQNPTPEEKEIIEQLSKEWYEVIEVNFKNLREKYKEAKGMTRNELFVFWQKKLKERETKLEEEERKLEAEKKKLEEEQKGSYRKSRHLVEAINQKKALRREERTLFSNIKEDALTNEIKIPPIIGVSLTRSERKLTNCFSIMLQQRSNTYNDKAKDYYSGDNKNPRKVKYGDKVTAPIPELKFTHFELTKAYTGKENPSGKEMQIVENILNGLLSKTFLIEREVIYRDKKTKEDIKYMFRGHEPLIIMGKRIDKSDENRDKTQDLIIALNSLFVLQIRNFYVTYPMDIDQRIEEAYGSKNVPDAIYTFIDYLASLRGVTRNYTHEIYKSNLYKKISEKWLQESRLKMLEERTLKAIEVAQKIELLESWEEVDGATGEKKYIFKTNKTWIKENK